MLRQLIEGILVNSIKQRSALQHACSQCHSPAGGWKGKYFVSPSPYEMKYLVENEVIVVKEYEYILI
jgi:hypothetical protein